jgi:Protein of unknown function, DUF488
MAYRWREERALITADFGAPAKREGNMATVFTIGHSTRSYGEFLEILRAHGIKRVVDVRSIPRSRHNPQFNREVLSKKLRSARIGYVHLRKLGGLRRAPGFAEHGMAQCFVSRICGLHANGGI